MNAGDRCPRKHLSCRLGPPTSSGPVHRYRGPLSPQPPSCTWRGAGGAPGLPGSLAGHSGRRSYGWVLCGVTLPPQAQLPRDGPLVGAGGLGVSGEGRPLVRGQAPLTSSKAGLWETGGRHPGLCRAFQAAQCPQLAGRPRPSTPKAGRLVCAQGLLPPAP